jgi:hypothetical protein
VLALAGQAIFLSAGLDVRSFLPHGLQKVGIRELKVCGPHTSSEAISIGRSEVPRHHGLC